MKARTFVVIAAAAAAGYIITKDKAEKERVKWLIQQKVFKDYDGQKNDTDSAQDFADEH